MNIKKFLVGTSIGAVMLGVMAIPAFAAIAINNGSFENGTDPGAYATLGTGDTSITGWTVATGSVDYIGSYWTASNGNRSIDMSGNEPGSINQALSTISGHTYTVTFDMAGNSDGGAAVKTMSVDTGGTPTAYSFDSTGKTHDAMGWTPETYTFTAGGASTVLTFTSTTAGPWGPALDNVAITDTTPVVVGPTNKDQCKNNGWKTYGNMFKNQGDCVSFVATGGKNLPAGL